ncbi:acyl-CoA synthetase [Brochothrix campestris]|uniref:acyl-CoA synthetase n=1 Tax=Brochothrix campestris TaxID=2757 RepID=UPI0038D06E95
MNLQDLLAPIHYNIVDDIEKHRSDKTALMMEDESGVVTTLTYKELLNKANQFANALIKKGVKKGDGVLVIMHRSLETYIAYLGLWKVGAVISPASEMLKAKDLHLRFKLADIKGVVAHGHYTTEVDKANNDYNALTVKIAVDQHVASWDNFDDLSTTESNTFTNVVTASTDPALIAFTSGTTGNPKGVVHIHGWGYAHLRTASERWLDIREDDMVWATAGPGWQKWVWSPFLSVLGRGATGFLFQGRFNPEKQLTLVEKYNINVFCCTPTEYRLLAKVDQLERFNLDSLRSTVSAGEPLNSEVINIFQEKFGLKVRDGYGQTESTLLIGTLKDAEIRPGSMGQPLLPEFIHVIDENGQPVKEGEVGDIAILRSFPALFKGYHKEPERLAKAIRGDYFVTGDRATFDADNYFWFQGRNDDIIISSGYTIGPFEVEDALTKHPAVKEVGVVASPHEFRGAIVKAFIVLTDGYTASDDLVKELQNFTKKITAPYKYPRSISFVSALPKTDSGKVKRVTLRNQEYGIK